MPQAIRTICRYEREPLSNPLGFKGRSMNELWQVLACMEDAEGRRGIGLGVQSVLWSDAAVFATRSEYRGNREMLQVTRLALQRAGQWEWETPLELLDQILPLAYEDAKKITNRKDLRLTYALNALVAVDLAAWQLYAKERMIDRFDDLIPERFRCALSFRNDRLAWVPLISYGTPLEEVEQRVREGAGLLKIKIGSDPDGDGCLDKMLEWDQARLSAIHERLRDCETSDTDSGRIAYYLDANGRYDGKDRLMRLLDQAAKIGALDRILLLEEPFPEPYREPVHDIPVRLAADESAHTDRDAWERMDLGYRAIALKPIAKTLSMTLKIAQAAWERKVPCFCADLTVNPVLVDWNKNLAARLAPLPGMKIGLLEANGPQNYRDWERLLTYHPQAGAAWLKPQKGCFTLNSDFYLQSGGIFETGNHYRELADLSG